MFSEDEWFNLDELAIRWGKSEAWIEKKLFIGKLKPSILLPDMNLRKCRYEGDEDGPYIVEHEDVYHGGLFYINGYKNIKWHQKDGISCFDLSEQNISLGDCESAESGKYFEVGSIHEVSKSEIVISLQEVNRFETENSMPIKTESPQLQDADILDNSVEQPVRETEKELCERLELEGFDKKYIAKELKREFPNMLNFAIGKLLPANPGANISSSGHRKQGARLLK